MNKKIEELIKIIPFLKEMSGLDAEINIWDMDGVDIGSFPSQEFKMPFHVGFHITDKADPIFDVMQSGKRQFVQVPQEVFGHCIEGYITPIKDGSEIVGCVTYVFSTEKNQNITQQTESLNHLISSSSESLSEIWRVFSDITDKIGKVHDTSKTINEELKKVQEINVEIQKNANYANILALNASIESARVGAAGKGFAVVSGEMRNFAKTSSDSAKAIDQTITGINDKLKMIYGTIHETLSVSSSQQENIETIKETLEQICSLSEKMKDFCKNF